MNITAESLEELRRAMKYESEHVGMAGCLIRARALLTLALIDYYESTQLQTTETSSEELLVF